MVLLPTSLRLRPGRRRFQVGAGTCLESEILSGCSGLKILTILGRVHSSGCDSFVGCDSLQNVTISRDSAVLHFISRHIDPNQLNITYLDDEK